MSGTQIEVLLEKLTSFIEGQEKTHKNIEEFIEAQRSYNLLIEGRLSKMESAGKWVNAVWVVLGGAIAAGVVALVTK